MESVTDDLRRRVDNWDNYLEYQLSREPPHRKATIQDRRPHRWPGRFHDLMPGLLPDGIESLRHDGFASLGWTGAPAAWSRSARSSRFAPETTRESSASR
ncbi:hypothetical protein [Mycobacterium sp.]|uniref:hypothetical protein n=1 Tax=Mycobacterium sp. TaxID=1785 RepID=UPI003D0C0C8C